MAGSARYAALKFLMIFFCSSHPKCVLLGSDFFVDWHCSSDVDKALFENIIFVRLSVGALSLEIDLLNG